AVRDHRLDADLAGGDQLCGTDAERAERLGEVVAADQLLALDLARIERQRLAVVEPDQVDGAQRLYHLQRLLERLDARRTADAVYDHVGALAAGEALDLDDRLDFPGVDHHIGAALARDAHPEVERVHGNHPSTGRVPA